MSLVRVITKDYRVLADKGYEKDLETAEVKEVCNKYKDAIGAYYFSNDDIRRGYDHPLFIPTDAYKKYLMDNNLW